MSRVGSLRKRLSAPGLKSGLLVACLGVTSVGALVVRATPASAAVLTNSTPFSGTRTLSSLGLSASGLGVTAATDLVTKLDWTQGASVSTTFDPNLVRQGQSPDPADSYARTGSGSMTLSWTLANTMVKWGPFNVGPFSPSFSASGPCDLKAGGPNYLCHLTSSQISLLDTFPIPGPYVKLGLAADVTITPQEIATMRQATFGATPDGTASLLLGELPITDTLPVPCAVVAGDHLTYTLGPLSTTPGISVVTSLAFEVGFETPTPVIVFPEIDIPFAKPTIPINTTTSTITMTSAGATFDLGPVLADLDPPVANSGGGPTHTYSATEGAAVALDGSASSDPHCGPPSLSWDFGDASPLGSGVSPSHTYQEEGTYHGTLTATNGAGLTATSAFTVNVADAALTATGRSIVVSNPVNATVASFVDADTTNTAGDSNQNPADYTATINWGDATTSPGTVVPNGVGFDITGSHTYSGANLGPQTISVHVCDVGGACADATSHLLVFSFLSHGAFVVGDQTAVSSASVVFWGARWRAQNSLSGGDPPASFKGFASLRDTAPPACPDNWTARPGNSAPFVGPLPTYMGVLVSSSITKNGHTISGDTVHIDVVKTNPGYAPDPGHPGTGTIVGQYC